MKRGSGERILRLFGFADEDVHIGVEEKFKTIIVGEKGKLSGIPLREFHWSRNIRKRNGEDV